MRATSPMERMLAWRPGGSVKAPGRGPRTQGAVASALYSTYTGYCTTVYIHVQGRVCVFSYRVRGRPLDHMEPTRTRTVNCVSAQFGGKYVPGPGRGARVLAVAPPRAPPAPAPPASRTTLIPAHAPTTRPRNTFDPTHKAEQYPCILNVPPQCLIMVHISDHSTKAQSRASAVAMPQRLRRS